MQEGVSESEGRALLAGKFQNRENLKKFNASAKILVDLDVQLPLLTTYLIEKSSDFRTGIQLEFATRLLLHQAVSVRKALEKRK